MLICLKLEQLQGIGSFKVRRAANAMAAQAKIPRIRCIHGATGRLGLLVAEELGVDVDKVRVSIGDTSALGFNFVTAGSRGTFASGMAAVIAAREAIDTLRARAAQIWEVPVDGVMWEDGHARPTRRPSLKSFWTLVAELGCTIFLKWVSAT